MRMKKILFLLAIGVLLVSVSAWAEEGNAGENKIDIGELTCKQLMAGNDMDREIGIAFYHGYFAGKNDNRVVDLPKASALSTDVKDYCLSNPASTVMDAFAKASK